MSTVRNVTAVTFALILTFILACGGDDDDAGGTPAPGTSTGTPATTTPTSPDGTPPGGITPPDGTPVEVEGLPFEEVDRGSASGISVEEETIFLVRSQQGWEGFWDDHAGVTIPAAPAPEIDFEQRMVLAVIDTSQPATAFSIEVAGITLDDGVLAVTAVRRAPGEGCIVQPAIVTPYHFVSVEKLEDAQPVLLTIEQTIDC